MGCFSIAPSVTIRNRRDGGPEVHLSRDNRRSLVKNSIITMTAPRKECFRNESLGGGVGVYHLLSLLLSNMLRIETPPSGRNRGKLITIAGLLYVLGDWIIGVALTIRPPVVKGLLGWRSDVGVSAMRYVIL